MCILSLVHLSAWCMHASTLLKMDETESSQSSRKKSQSNRKYRWETVYKCQAETTVRLQMASLLDLLFLSVVVCLPRRYIKMADDVVAAELAMPPSLSPTPAPTDSPTEFQNPAPSWRQVAHHENKRLGSKRAYLQVR